MSFGTKYSGEEPRRAGYTHATCHARHGRVNVGLGRGACRRCEVREDVRRHRSRLSEEPGVRGQVSPSAKPASLCRLEGRFLCRVKGVRARVAESCGEEVARTGWERYEVESPGAIGSEFVMIVVASSTRRVDRLRDASPKKISVSHLSRDALETRLVPSDGHQRERGPACGHSATRKQASPPRNPEPTMLAARRLPRCSYRSRRQPACSLSAGACSTSSLLRTSSRLSILAVADACPLTRLQSYVERLRAG